MLQSYLLFVLPSKFNIAYVHRNRKANYYRRVAQEGYLDFHTAPEHNVTRYEGNPVLSFVFLMFTSASPSWKPADKGIYEGRAN